MVDLTKDLGKTNKEKEQLVQEKKAAETKAGAMQKMIDILNKKPD